MGDCHVSNRIVLLVGGRQHQVAQGARVQLRGISLIQVAQQQACS
jgi:hypothetical protein